MKLIIDGCFIEYKFCRVVRPPSLFTPRRLVAVDIR